MHVFQRSHSVQIHNTIHAIVARLQRHIIFNGAQIVAQMLAPGWARTRKHSRPVCHACPLIVSVGAARSRQPGVAGLRHTAPSARQLIAQQTHYLARLRMPPRGKLGVHEPAIQGNFIHPANCGQQAHSFQLRLKLCQNLNHQTGGSFGKASRSAVTYFNDMLHNRLCAQYSRKAHREYGAIVLTLTRFEGTTKNSQRR